MGVLQHMIKMMTDSNCLHFPELIFSWNEWYMDLKNIMWCWGVVLAQVWGAELDQKVQGFGATGRLSGRAVAHHLITASYLFSRMLGSAEALEALTGSWSPKAWARWHSAPCRVVPRHTSMWSLLLEWERLWIKAKCPCVWVLGTLGRQRCHSHTL